MVAPPAKFIQNLDFYIHGAEAGEDPRYAQALLAYFVHQVANGEVSDQHVLGYIARAFWKALDLASGQEPGKVDPRQPLGLVRPVGHPKNDAWRDALGREAGQYFNELLRSVSWDHARQETADKFYMSSRTAERRQSEAAAEESAELGGNVWRRVQADLAAEAEKDPSVLSRVEQRVFADFAKTTGQKPERIESAYRRFVEACAAERGSEERS